MLIRRQPCGVLSASLIHNIRAVVAGVDKVENRCFFGEDGIKGEPLVAFALMCCARRGQPQPDLVDGGLDQLLGVCARCPRAVVRRRSQRIGRVRAAFSILAACIGQPRAVERECAQPRALRCARFLKAAWSRSRLRASARH